MSSPSNQEELYEILKKSNNSIDNIIIDFLNDIEIECILTREQKEALTVYIEIYHSSIILYKKDLEYYDKRNVDSKNLIDKAKKEIEFVYGNVDDYKEYLQLLQTNQDSDKLEEQIKIYESTLYFLNNFSTGFRKLKPNKPTKVSLKNEIEMYFNNSIKKELPSQAIKQLLSSLI